MGTTEANEGEVMEGKAIDDVAAHVDSNASASLPHSGTHMASGIGVELSADFHANNPAPRQATEEEENPVR